MRLANVCANSPFIPTPPSALFPASSQNTILPVTPSFIVAISANFQPLSVYSRRRPPPHRPAPPPKPQPPAPTGFPPHPSRFPLPLSPHSPGQIPFRTPSNLPLISPRHPPNGIILLSTALNWFSIGSRKFILIISSLWPLLPVTAPCRVCFRAFRTAFTRSSKPSGSKSTSATSSCSNRSISASEWSRRVPSGTRTNAISDHSSASSRSPSSVRVCISSTRFWLSFWVCGAAAWGSNKK